MSLTQLLFSSEGRIRRSTYWLYSFGVAGVFLIALFADLLLGTYNQDTGYGVISIIIRLLSIIPGIIVGVKRCHDRDHSGWFMLLLFVPILNLWPFIELSFLAGTDGPNSYGPDPRRPQVSQANSI